MEELVEGRRQGTEREREGDGDMAEDGCVRYGVRARRALTRPVALYSHPPSIRRVSVVLENIWRVYTRIPLHTCPMVARLVYLRNDSLSLLEFGL